MRQTILSAFERQPYFTIDGFRQIAGDHAADNAHARTALYRWAKAGHLLALKKGVYMHHRFYEQHRQDAAFAPAVSAILLPQSYLSLEYVLQQQEILTEITYPVTAITIKKRAASSILWGHLFTGTSSLISTSASRSWKRTAYPTPRHRQPKPCLIISTCARCRRI